MSREEKDDGEKRKTRFLYLSVYFWIIEESFWKSILSIMAVVNEVCTRKNAIE